MEITNINFKQKFPDIKSAIKESDFLAFDCEFSGLNIGPEVNINSYDSFEQYYTKLRRNVKKFLVLQFGLCTFRFDKILKRFEQKCFNFYLFPRPTNKSIPDTRFLCQSSSIDFLSNHDFDFNKVFKYGITYLNSVEQTEYKNVLQEKFKKQMEAANTQTQTSMNKIPIPEEDKEFVNETLKLIEMFLASSREDLDLPICNSFRRRLIYQTAGEKFGTSVCLETRKVENERILFVQKPKTLEQIAETEQLKYEERLVELEDALGFSRVIKLIAESGKLIIGHNLLLDMLHIVDKFLMPLPENYAEFKECTSCLFPNVIDTKTLANSLDMKELIDNTILSKLVETFKTEAIFEIPEIVIAKNSEGYNLNDNKDHEAGFDAFITGVCFLTMSKYLDKNNDAFFYHTAPALKQYLNKIFVMKLLDCNYLNLSGPDPKPNRDNVLYITFPKEWKTIDINQLFSPFGNIHIAWINDTSAFISLFKKDQAPIALSTLSRSQNERYKVISYDRFQTLLNSHKHVPVAHDLSTSLKKRRETEIETSVKSKKRRRNASFGESSKPMITTIAEEPEDATEFIATRMTKMFDENCAWE